MVKLDHIYDLRRDCLLNELYYGHRLSVFSRVSLWLEVVIVLGSGASGISGWIIWTTHPELKAIWAGIAGFATLLAALKPVAHIDAKVKHYSMLFINYRQLSISMDRIVEDISEAHGLTSEIEREAGRVRTRYKALAGDDDPRPSRKLVLELQSEINRRIPITALFYPPVAEAQPRATSERSAQAAGMTKAGVDRVEPWPTGSNGHAHE